MGNGAEMKYSLKPWVHVALKELDLVDRIRTRWRLHRLLSRASKHDNRVAWMESYLDCGPALADEITRGKYGRETKARDALLAEAKALLLPLKSIYEVKHGSIQDER